MHLSHYKLCSRCEISRPITEFNRRKHICDNCERYARRIYYLQNPLKIRNYQKLYRKIKNIKSKPPTRAERRAEYRRNRFKRREKANAIYRMPIQTLIRTTANLNIDRSTILTSFKIAWVYWASSGFKRSERPRIAYNIHHQPIGFILADEPREEQVQDWSRFFEAQIKDYRTYGSTAPTLKLIKRFLKLREIYGYQT